ncbi:hypothetical protein ADUPG1_001206 [Aduncisulcus paluster]|uniref:Uncharacterized protein n=1 Tax=Aduncisulcus paluster TaxID=2918883 RepID=A0ABQ5KAB3_9EUKA|nr:hypothetical protein ADUPG1_001206 [Aduncisulcus paluster]
MLCSAFFLTCSPVQPCSAKAIQSSQLSKSSDFKEFLSMDVHALRLKSEGRTAGGSIRACLKEKGTPQAGIAVVLKKAFWEQPKRSLHFGLVTQQLRLCIQESALRRNG